MVKKKSSASSKANKTVVLKVTEAWSKDVGRGIARIDPDDMSKLGVDVGDIIELKSKRATVAKVMPTFQNDRGKGIVQIDGLVRTNCQGGLDEKATITKATATRPGVSCCRRVKSYRPWRPRATRNTSAACWKACL